LKESREVHSSLPKAPFLMNQIDDASFRFVAVDIVAVVGDEVVGDEVVAHS